MERVSKFRGKTGTIWVEGYFVKDYEGTAYITTLDGVDTYVVDEKTVSYFTGLTDKLGTDIYERDVVEWENEATGINGKSEIRYSSRLARYEVQDGDTWYQMNPIAIKYIVIGNAFENPELLSTDKTKTV